MNPQMSRLLRRKQQLWVYLIAVLFVADFISYGYMPSRRRLQSLKQAGAQQEAMIRTAAMQSKKLPGLKQRLKTVEEIVEHYDAYVPEERALGAFLQDIAHMMTEHRLTDQVVVPQDEMRSSGVRCIPVHMNCKGSLSDLFGFFGDLQTMGRLVRIEKTVLTNDNEYTGQVSLHTEAVIFYRAPQSRDLADDTSRKALANEA
jgi:Tfp pilus assembly protein PilO